MSSGKKYIYLVRHGKSRANETGVRESDPHATPLTEEGRQQAKIVAERFKTIPIELVMTSPYIRAHDTADEIARVKNVPVEVIEHAYERIFPVGEAANKPLTVPAIQKIYRELDTRWRTGAAVDGGEGFYQVLERVKATSEVLAARPETHIALATHGLFTKMFVAYHLLHEYLTPELFMESIMFRMKSQNTGITFFEITKEGNWILLAWNDYAHLGEL